MCDEEHFEKDMQKYSRRDAGALAAGIGASLILPQVANAVEVREREMMIKTPDGNCDAFFVSPTTGAHAAVLIWPDIFGLRPAFRKMGKRLSESGYSVLVVNPFYRTKKAPTAAKGAKTPIQEVIPLARSLDAKKHVTDAEAFVQWLDDQPEVDKRRKIGVTGYCMGGPIVMRTAAAEADRIGAAATFHGGGLVTDAPDSPHLLIPKMKAEFLIAIAENDDERDPQAKATLKKAFANADLTAEIEVYPAGHGWCPPDTRVHNREQAEKAWQRMLALFSKTLA